MKNVQLISTEFKCKFCSHVFTKEEIKRNHYYKTNIRNLMGIQHFDYACMYHPETRKYIFSERLGACAIPKTDGINITVPEADTMSKLPYERTIDYNPEPVVKDENNSI